VPADLGQRQAVPKRERRPGQCKGDKQQEHCNDDRTDRSNHFCFSKRV
jgi:hypothetical protein